MDPWALFDHAPLLGLLLVAAIIDARQRRIPNWLTFGLILAAIARGAFFGGALGIGWALAGLIAGAFVPFILFSLGALGGGDVKLMAAIGAWLGPRDALAIYFLQCLIGLLLVLVQAVMQRRTAALFRNTAVLAAGFAHHGIAANAPATGGKVFTSIDRPLPYAVPVMMATMLVLLLHRLPLL